MKQDNPWILFAWGLEWTRVNYFKSEKPYDSYSWIYYLHLIAQKEAK